MSCESSCEVREVANELLLFLKTIVAKSGGSIVLTAEDMKTYDKICGEMDFITDYDPDKGEFLFRLQNKNFQPRREFTVYPKAKETQ